MSECCLHWAAKQAVWQCQNFRKAALLHKHAGLVGKEDMRQAYIRVVAGKPREADQGPNSKGAMHCYQAQQCLTLQKAFPRHITQRLHTLFSLAADLNIAAAWLQTNTHAV